MDSDHAGSLRSCVYSCVCLEVFVRLCARVNEADNRSK